MAMLKKSRRNLQACTEVGLISCVLDMLKDTSNMVAGNSSYLEILPEFDGK